MIRKKFVSHDCCSNYHGLGDLKQEECILFGTTIYSMPQNAYFHNPFLPTSYHITIFLNLTPESVISPKDPDSFYWRMVFRSLDLNPGFVYCY